LLEELQELPTLKQIISFDIEAKYIISDYNQGHIIWELRTRDTSIEQGLREYSSQCAEEDFGHNQSMS
jgi:hypothetical protein